MGKGKRIIILVMFIGAIAVFGFSLWKTIGINRAYEKGDRVYSEIESQVVAENVEFEPKITDDPKDLEKEPQKESMISVDVKKLQTINKEVVGWIYIPNSAISYPLVQGQDNEKYLHKTYNGADSIYGSIFVSNENSGDFSDLHTVIYGHNMRNGSMFGSLKKYSDSEYFKNHRNIYIFTEKETYRYRVFSCHVTNATGKIYKTIFDDSFSYAEFLDMAKSNTQIRTNLEVSELDKTITLSTCTGNEATRFVVHGKYMGKVTIE